MSEVIHLRPYEPCDASHLYTPEYNQARQEYFSAKNQVISDSKPGIVSAEKSLGELCKRWEAIGHVGVEKLIAQVYTDGAKAHAEAVISNNTGTIQCTGPKRSGKCTARYVSA